MIVIVGSIVLLVAVVVGVVGVLGNAGSAHSNGLLAGARRAASRGQDARRELAQTRLETAFLNRDLAILHEHQSTGAETGSTARAEPRGAQVSGNGGRLLRPWPLIRRPAPSVRRGASR